jgi:pimeloyl-ACP methyl ester carboxylesterase
MGALVSKAVFTPPRSSYHIDHKAFHEIKNPRDGHRIPLVSVVHRKPKFAILYSHGNAEDLGELHKWCETLSLRFGASVYSYDYRGYGASGSTASEENVFSDAAAVMEHLKKFHAEEDIVLFGRSLGCAPSIATAAAFPDAKALILESPFLTCVKTVLPTPFTFWFDMFRNEVNIKRCGQPTLIIHGKMDGVVPFSHGVRLLEECPNALDHLWLERAGHNDIDTTYRSDLFRKCAHFLSTVDPEAVTPLRRRVFKG